MVKRILRQYQDHREHQLSKHRYRMNNITRKNSSRKWSRGHNGDFQGSANITENCQTTEICITKIIWRIAPEKEKRGEYQIWQQKRTEISEKRSYDIHILCSPNILQLFGSESILAPMLLQMSFPACCIPSFRIWNRQRKSANMFDRIPAFLHLCHYMLTQLTAVACAGVGRKPAANNKDWATAHLGSQLKGTNFAYEQHRSKTKSNNLC